MRRAAAMHIQLIPSNDKYEAHKAPLKVILDNGQQNDADITFKYKK